jgi:hypothetical protein
VQREFVPVVHGGKKMPSTSVKHTFSLHRCHRSQHAGDVFVRPELSSEKALLKKALLQG